MTHAKTIDFRKHFFYDHSIGRLIRIRTGLPAYVLYKQKKSRLHTERPYGVVKFGDKKLAVHRLVWAVVHGTWPDGIIDHINRDSTDNRIENLRLVDPRGNSRNKSMASNNSSGHNGIDMNGGRWRVRVGEVFGGRYDDLSLAIKVRDLLYRELGYSDDHGV